MSALFNPDVRVTRTSLGKKFYWFLLLYLMYELIFEQFYTAIVQFCQTSTVDTATRIDGRWQTSMATLDNELTVLTPCRTVVAHYDRLVTQPSPP